jgi:hypothetical protein
MRGIVDLLTDTFYPKYKYLKSKRPAGEKSVPKLKKKKGVQVGAIKKFPKSKWQGQRRGSRVDKEIACIVNGGMVANPHDYTARALSALRECNLHPFAAQVVVYHAEARLASAVDILCVDVDGATAIVELKCSSDSKYTHSCQPMKGVMQTHCDSLQEQHFLQAAVTTHLYRNVYGNSTKMRTYVLRVNDLGAHMTKVRQLNEYEEAFNHIIKKSLNRADRKKKLKPFKLKKTKKCPS